MNKPFSLYLDLVRFLAALAVFAAHLCKPPISKEVVWWRLGAYGDMAVVIFFVLSGYVIAYVVATREKTPGEYFLSRWSRLYSVVLPGLAATFLFDAIGHGLNGDIYNYRMELAKPSQWVGYVSSLFFINEFQIFGFDGAAPGSNGPFWSLSFEATYYVVAGLLLFVRPAVSVPGTVLLLAMGGRTITTLLPLWALGFFLYRWQPARTLPKVVLMALAGATLALMATVPFLPLLHAVDNFGVMFPWGAKPYNRDLVPDYAAAMLFALHLACVRALLQQQPMDIPKAVERSLRWLGALTFPLYLLHYPVIHLLAAVSPWPVDSLARVGLVCAGTVVAVVGLTPLCDGLKTVLRRFGQSVFTRVQLALRWHRGCACGPRVQRLPPEADISSTPFGAALGQ
jgi:peptidoglycan/LPS O-acetylase OafA/YrhL